MEQNQTKYDQTKLTSVFARCLEFAKSQPQNNRNLKNIELILDKLKGGVCFGYSIAYHNVGQNFTKINKYIINKSNKHQDQEGYAKWLLKNVDNDIFQMLYGKETINKMTNLDFIIYFCESMVIAQSADILKLALGVNNSVNNDLQANFIQNGDFCNEFILSKDNQVLVLEAKKNNKNILHE